MEGNKRTFAYRSKEELNYDPFKDMNISSHVPLEGLKRSKCPGCQASRMYFCYKCYLYVDTLDASKIPKVKVSSCFFIFCFDVLYKVVNKIVFKVQNISALLSLLHLTLGFLFFLNILTKISTKKQRNVYF